MMRSLSELMGYRMDVEDGKIGKAHDFLFDDQAWTIRHLVVDTGTWLPGRQVLIAPQALGEPDWDKQLFPVSLTKAQIEDSPSLDADQPVSRQQEMELFRYYAWTPYWGAGMMGPYAQPAGLAVPREPEPGSAADDTHLRSVRHVQGYHIAAADGEIGHIEDFIAADENWVVRYIVASTRNWLPGRKVLLAPDWLKDIDWADRTAATDLRRDDIRNSPPYDPGAPVNRAYEERLYDFYGRPKHWNA
ncbi:MAG: PRC-barrel domain containing protein [Lentisphaerae bacterium]|nr:PRC-barrel domain containing protein [Lentisphaerota bacterium]